MDTQSKRASAVAHGRMWMRARVTPTGTFDNEERAAASCTYNGNAFEAVVGYPPGAASPDTIGRQLEDRP